MFEGTPAVFHTSLQKLAALPSDTKVYCTHEYTQANLAFAKSVDANNNALQEYSAWVDTQRKDGKITLPSSIAKECEINPFLRCRSDEIRASIFEEHEQSHESATEVQTFARLRQLKDNF